MSDWFTKPFERFLAFVSEADKVLHLSIKGIAQASRQVQMLEALDNWDRVKAECNEIPYTPRTPKDFDSAKIEADFAKQEMEKDFPLLHAHTLVSVWSAMEALFEDVLVAHIISKSEILKEEGFQKIRIPLATYEQLNQEDKARLLVTELQRSLSSEQRLGLDCFERLLRIIGLGGEVKPKIRRDIYELQQLRHTIVHRASLADRKLIEACPWLKLKSGERIHISHKQYHRLMEAAHKYVVLVIKRATAIEVAKRKFNSVTKHTIQKRLL
jgi:hypothetical protein